MRFIGPVNGDFNKYNLLIKNIRNSIQLGDMGLNYDNFFDFTDFRFDKNHRFIRGELDHLDLVKSKYIKTYIGDIAVECNKFFIGGAKTHTEKSSFKELPIDNEISYLGLSTALKIYKQVKPNIVISHDCPCSISADNFSYLGEVVKPNRTNLALENMFNYHKPEYWIFGHWSSKIHVIDGTTFISVGPGEYIDLNI